MESLTELFRIGYGPSASHTMGPRKASEIFLAQQPNAHHFRVILYGSLAATGKGHLTDQAITEALKPHPVEVVWRPETELPLHPNGMEFEAFDKNGSNLGAWRVYSVGGGALKVEGASLLQHDLYDLNSMEEILAKVSQKSKPLWCYVIGQEGEELWDYLKKVWHVMRDSVRRGYNGVGTLPGELKLPRKSFSFFLKARQDRGPFQRTNLLFAYSLAVSEENAAGGQIVTAPTCGSCGVLPAILYYLQEMNHLPEKTILQAIATAGLIGNLVKTNGSISGAEVGCQGEIGTACAMAAGAAVQLLGGSPAQVEYAAEMGFEHHLGLTCDPVAGLVQIPCIERNAFASTRALDSAEYALLSDGRHRISFDEVVKTMMQTGHDLKLSYRETSTGGLAAIYPRKNNPGENKF
ncbi:MAG TPA: L-serine ammonia-lyase [Firmicutes bacterium]|jgi:L-serine dehydratase|nr:L-serine ammonia-lyase [Bacillota bacterium]